MYGGITPFNVWDLPYRLWVAFAQSADEYVKQQTREARDG